MGRLLLLGLCACASGADDTDTGKDGDTEETAEPKIDTGVALVYFEGAAALTASSWDGREEWVATSLDGRVEHCRVVNAVTGTPAEVELCPGCTFAFAVTAGDGTMTGDACENVRFYETMWTGASWIYAFAPTYVYGDGGYTYEDVLLYGYVVNDTVSWSITAFAETDESTVIDYESVYSDLWTYFYY